MKTMLSLILICLVCMLPKAQADSGSTSGSCSGTLNQLGYFYAYTYQYAYLYNGVLGSESHSFSFSGFLSEMKTAKIIGANEKFVVYRSQHGRALDLAVPFKSGAGLFVKYTASTDFPGEKSQGWINLCRY